ncbi:MULTISPECIES: hypothetical protein [unclassified Oleiphilus]|uniref:hypothetical protein n=1 Tax=unclassified Oleiphilus TaxID=2631174 RepID=UPI0007C208B3|nr:MULTISPECIES: hypothetical protein [unclassified Oleiphilus]KZY46062.1 hypothetical protein A3732_08235 [Oleiphilus sp. HI0050]KZZ38011.1 hypothetical protein A3757_09120 [Oleiphilus sp. HI0117]KZZ56182.1 hypothetical protein A3761_09705 [Oleiphilus sp. HI0123]
MTMLYVVDNKNTFERLQLEVDSTVGNLGEGLCFRFGIPKYERQLVTFFGSLSNSDNYAAVSNWVYEMIISSEAITQAELTEEIESKFNARLSELY